MGDYNRWRKHVQWVLLREAQRLNKSYAWFDETGVNRVGVTIATFRWSRL